jgi:hypothetical protein
MGLTLPIKLKTYAKIKKCLKVLIINPIFFWLVFGNIPLAKSCVLALPYLH